MTPEIVALFGLALVIVFLMAALLDDRRTTVRRLRWKIIDAGHVSLCWLFGHQWRPVRFTAIWYCRRCAGVRNVLRGVVL